MKHNMNRVLSIVALLMLTIGAWADAERVNITTTGGGELKYNISGTTCTLTATPASGYYLTVENLTAVKVISGSVVQAPARRSIEIDENVTITATNASADPSGVTTYTFTMPTDENISVNVTAEFQTLIEINPTVSIEGWTYGGTTKTPTVSGNTGSGQVTYLYTGGNNYSSADAPTSAGSYTVKASIAASGKYAAGECTANFTIAKADFSQLVISDIVAQTYTGSEIKPAITVTFNNSTVDASEYSVGYSNNTNAGTATVTLTTTNKNFAAGETNPSKNFTITGKTITDNMVSLNTNTFVFNNAVQVPVVTVTDGTYTLVGDDYDVSYELVNGQTTTELGSSNDVKNVGSYNVVVKGKGNYSGTVSATFTINAANIGDATIAGIAEQTFTGSAITPALTVTLTFGETQTELEQGKDYTVSYSNNVNVGQATATITGKGNYTGTRTANFNITAKAITNAMVTLGSDPITYDGSAKTPTVTVVDGQTTLTENTDYEVSYQKVVGQTTEVVQSPTDAGTYNVVVTAKENSNYSGTALATFTIAKADFSQLVISDIDAQTYTGSEIKPAITVTFNNSTVDASEYIVGYSNNKNAGTATVTLTTTNKNFAAGETNPSKNFTIASKSITDDMVSLNTNTFVFNNTAQVPNVSVTDGTTTLVGDDYDVSYELVNGQTTTALESSDAVKNVGSYNVVVTGKGNYTGTVKKSFAITQATLANLAVVLEGWTYGTEPNDPSVEGNLGNGGVNYTYSVYAENPEAQEFTSAVPTNAGSYIVKATVAETANYQGGEATKNFTIAKANFAEVEIADIDAQTYTGSEIKPAITVTYNDMTVDDSEYTIGYSNNKNAGTATVTLTTTNKNFAAGETNPSKNFTITGKTITDNMVTLTANSFVYSGETPNLVMTVMDGSTELTEETDYTISYQVLDGETVKETEDVVDVATYNVVVTGTGNYTGSATKSFAITKAQLALTVSLENWTYGEQPKEIDPSVDGNEGEGGETFYFKAKNADDSKYSEVVPENAGDYTLKVVVAETDNYASGSATADFTISKAYLTVEGVRELTVSITGWKYGAEHAGPTVSGNLGNADVTYTYKDGKDDQAEFSVTVPTTVGSYIVKATVAESDNYFGGEAYNEFSIEKGDIPTPTVSTIDGQTYDGQAHNIFTVSGVPTGTTVKYYYAGITASDYNNESFELLCEPGEDEFSATVPTTTDAGYFALLYRIDGGDNYNDIEAGRLIKVAFVPASISEVTIDKTSMEYTGEAQTVTITSVKAGTMNLTANDYTVSYEMVDEDEKTVQVDAPVETGTYNVVVTGKGNFTGTESATFTIVNRTLADGEVTFHEGWATYCSLIGDVNLPAGIGAYVASGLGNGVVTLTQISYIPAKEPVLLNNATTTTTDNTEYPFNLLQYAGEDIDVDDMYYYGLHNGAFMRVTGTIPEGKIYLYAEEPNAPQLTIVIDGETTGINEIETMRNVDNENVYNLMGRKVQKPSKKGLYISNGHKVVVNK